MLTFKPSARVIDDERFEATLGSGSQAEIFAKLAEYVRQTGNTVETMELFTGSERFMATVTVYVEDK